MFLKAIVIFCSLSMISSTRQIPSKEDCIALWNAVGGAGGKPIILAFMLLMLIFIWLNDLLNQR
jgi:hypothetical protein